MGRRARGSEVLGAALVLVLLGVHDASWSAEKTDKTKSAGACEPLLVDRVAKTDRRPGKRSPIGKAEDYFVLDTNVWLNNPEAFRQYAGKIVIPLQVLEELDDKKSHERLGFPTRKAVTLIDEIRLRGKTTVVNGQIEISMEGGPTFVLWKPQYPSAEAPATTKMDNQIIQAALDLAQELAQRDGAGGKVSLVTDDKIMRIKATALGHQHGLNVLGYKPVIGVSDESMSADQSYPGYRELQVSREAFQRLRDMKNKTPVEMAQVLGLKDGFQPPLRSNEVLVIRREGDPSPVEDVEVGLSAPAFRFKANLGQLVPVPRVSDFSLPVTPRNLEQRIALDLALDPDIKMLFLMGAAGSGKNMISTMSAVLQVGHRNITDKIYNQIRFHRNPTPMGKGDGFLPGTEEEKTEPWTRAVKDTLEVIENAMRKASVASGGNQPESEANHGGMGERQQRRQKGGKKENWGFNREKGGRDLLTQLIESKKLVAFEAVSTQRGSTWSDTVIILDEAQNFPREVLNALIDRTGAGSKVIILGDTEQVDDPYLTSENNGLAHKLAAVRELLATAAESGHPQEYEGADLSLVGLIQLWRAERSAVVQTNKALKRLESGR